MHSVLIVAARMAVYSLVGALIGCLLAWIVLPVLLMAPVGFVWVATLEAIHGYATTQASDTAIVLSGVLLALVVGVGNEVGRIPAVRSATHARRRTTMYGLVVVTLLLGFANAWLVPGSLTLGSTSSFAAFQVADLLLFALVCGLLVQGRVASSTQRVPTFQFGTPVKLGLACGAAFAVGSVLIWLPYVLVGVRVISGPASYSTSAGLLVYIIVLGVLGVAALPLVGAGIGCIVAVIVGAGNIAAQRWLRTANPPAVAVVTQTTPIQSGDR